MTKIAVPGGDSKEIFWYKAEPQKMLDDLMDIEPAEFGYLVILRNLMFLRDGSIADEKSMIRRYLGLTAKGWPTIRNKFLHLGKIYIAEDGRLRSIMVDQWIAEATLARSKSSNEWKRRKDLSIQKEFANDSNDPPHTDTVTVTDTVSKEVSKEEEVSKEVRKKEAAPSPPFNNGAVAAQASKESGEQGEPKVKVDPNGPLGRHLKVVGWV